MDKTKLRIKILDILKRGYSDDANYADLDAEVADKLLELIGQLLSERTFTKEELDFIDENLTYGEGTTYNLDMYSNLLLKICKLSEEKENERDKV